MSYWRGRLFASFPIIVCKMTLVAASISSISRSRTAIAAAVKKGATGAFQLSSSAVTTSKEVICDCRGGKLVFQTTKKRASGPKCLVNQVPQSLVIRPKF